MNKKVLVGFVVVFVLMEIMSYLIHDVILGSTYASMANLWRADMTQYMWVYHVISIIGAFFFAFVFSKGYEGKGVAEGLRYGLYIGIWMSVGMAYGSFAMYPIPYSLALQWFIYGVIEYLIYGAALAMVFGKSATVTKVAAP